MVCKTTGDRHIKPCDCAATSLEVECPRGHQPFEAKYTRGYERPELSLWNWETDTLALEATLLVV